ncbi:MAG: hypothetical protein RL154_1481 [Pseudomonadota bacterium]|jgi:hypothetical protein
MQMHVYRFSLYRFSNSFGKLTQAHNNYFTISVYIYLNKMVKLHLQLYQGFSIKRKVKLTREFLSRHSEKMWFGDLVFSLDLVC